jgi:acetyl-CoA carboxylase carboxyl transferase subunit beta
MTVPLNMIFRKPKNELEKGGRVPVTPKEPEGEMTESCPACGTNIPLSELWENLHVCPNCGHCFRINARQRIGFLTDKDSFRELFSEIRGTDVLQFPGYAEKLEKIRKSTGESEAVICGEAAIKGEACALFVMDPYFMMGSMGAAVGERITRLFEYASDRDLPVVGCTVSGGARMQEGLVYIDADGQNERRSQASQRQRPVFLTVITDPTTGGVTASFAMEGDIIMAEPGATIGFAGARVN